MPETLHRYTVTYAVPVFAHDPAEAIMLFRRRANTDDSISYAIELDGVTRFYSAEGVELYMGRPRDTADEPT